MKTLLACLLSLTLVPAVLLSATHAKDIVAPPDAKKVLGASSITKLKLQTARDDPMAKSIGDLHNHIDKTMLKHVAKSTASVHKQVVRRNGEDIVEAHPISTRLLEFGLKLQLLFAYGLSVIRIGA